MSHSEGGTDPAPQLSPDDRVTTGETRTPPPYLRRRPRGLLWFWTIGLAAAGLLFWITWKLPALDELLRPGYWVIAILLAVFTFRWFRPRIGRRRRGDRRQADRRDSGTIES